MAGIENYLGFLLAGILLNLSPGTDTMYIMTRSIAQGKKAGILSVLGISTGGLIHTLFAAFGLSAILVTSSVVFQIIKYAGAAYLVYLGIRALLTKDDSLSQADLELNKTDLNKIYRQGIFTNILNPKVALFFLSFLPQFIDVESTQGPAPFLILGGTFMLTGTLWCLVVAYAASYFTSSIRKNRRITKSMQKVGGLVFIFLGLNLALKIL